MPDPNELRRDKSILRKELFDVQAKINNPTYAPGEREMFQRRERQIFDAMDAIDKQLLELSQQQTSAMSAQAPQPNYQAPTQPSRAHKAWHWTRKNAKPIAAGAVAGAAATGAYMHDRARQGLSAAASGVGYVGSGVGAANQFVQVHSGNIAFIIIAFCVISFEFYSAWAGNWQTRVGIYTVLVFITMILFRDVALTKRAAVAAIVMNVLWYAYLSAAGTPAFSDMLTSQAAKAIVTLILLPSFAWWFLYLEPSVEISKLFRGAGGVVLGGMMLALVYPALTSAAGLVPMPATGFEPVPAARGGLQFILEGAGEALRDFVCFLGVGGQACGVADSWLARITEPFAYDATTVHEIQRHGLGVYIRNPRVDGVIDVTGYSAGRFLPKPIEFNVHAPIPQDLEIDLCDVRASDLKGFVGICDNTIRITCEIDGVSTTQIMPRSNVSIKNVVVPGLYSCRMQPPDDAALNRAGASVSKQGQIKVEYPFATTTFRLIRAVDIDQATSREAVAELEGFRENRIISSGGPVIVEVSDSQFLRVDGPGTAETLTIALKAQPEVRIEGIDSLYVFVPDGSVLEPFPGDTDSYCDFVVGEDIFEEHDLICNPERWTSCGSGEIQCHNRCIHIQDRYRCPEDPALAANIGRPLMMDGTEAGTRAEVSACMFSPEELLGPIMGDRPSQVYMLSKQAIERINADLASQRLEADARRSSIGSRDNSVPIQCQLTIVDPDEFLQRDVLVTERAVNIVSSYRVSHAQDINVRFSGNLGTPPLISFTGSHHAAADHVCSIEGLNVRIPVGIMPLDSSSGTNRLTDPFGSPRSNSVGFHPGVDLAGPSPGMNIPVRASWSGIVERVERGCPDNGQECGSGGYGNHVVIRTKNPTGSFIHIYAHLQSGSIPGEIRAGSTVRQGDPLGRIGNSGLSFGAHLHFEVRAENHVRLNPLLLLPREEVFALGQFGSGTIWPERVALKTNHRIDCVKVEQPIADQRLTNLSYEDIDKMLDSRRIKDISDEIGGFATEEKVQLIIEAAIARGVPPDILLGVAQQENEFRHTVGVGNDGVWEGIAISVDGVSLGMMQINSLSAEPTYCTRTMNRFNVAQNRDAYSMAQRDIVFNAHCGAEVLYDKYHDVARLLNTWDAYCGRSCLCDRRERYDQRDLFPPHTNQWFAAVKGYNGWGCQDTAAGALDYPKNVFEYANRVLRASGIDQERMRFDEDPDAVESEGNAE